MHTIQQTDAKLQKLFDASALVEVRKFNELPDGVKAHLDMSGQGEGPDGLLRKFMVGAFSSKSALVAYEEFGYVPSFYEEKYAYIGQQWIRIDIWPIGQISTVEGLNGNLREYRR